MQKFLVIQTAFTGDVVLATGIIEKLHHSYPDARIDFLVRKGNEGLLKDHPYLNEVIVWDKTKSKLQHLWQILRKIRRVHYDTVINVQRFAATGILTAFSNAKMKIGFDKNPLSFLFTKSVKHIISTADQPLHEIDRNQSLIASFTDKLPSKPRLYPSAADELKVEKYKGEPYIVVAPASVWFTKQYPVEKWIEFINLVPDNLKIYILGAPGDKELGETIFKGTTNKNVYNLCGELSFLQSVALQKDAKMNFVNDSAPMHFASSVNAPVTAIYCSTLPSFGFGPLSDQSNIVEIKETLSCRPCGLHGHRACPEGHFKCAWKIESLQLLEFV